MKSRLFIGYKIPRKIIETIEMTRSTLDDSQKYFNWVSGNNLHLTLLFLGDHPQESISDISSKIDSVIKLLIQQKNRIITSLHNHFA